MANDLLGFRNHCREMATSDDVSQVDRVLWVRLAGEVDDYLARDDDAQDALL